MKKFHFPLEKLLELRKYAEEQAEMKLAEYVGKCANLESDLDAMAGVLKRSRVANPGASTSAMDLMAAEAYRKRIYNTIDDTLEELALAEVEKRKRQEEYMEASKQAKVLEKLKEREFSAYKKSSLRHEARVLDEISTNLRSQHGTV